MRWCWHKWGIWIHNNLLRTGTKEIVGFMQSRQCLKCGKIERDVMEI